VRVLRSRELALVEQIGQYSEGRKNINRGLILRPVGRDDIKIDCYVEADFAGLWGYEHEQDPTSSNSRQQRARQRYMH
jgi:hypothetical protein